MKKDILIAISVGFATGAIVAVIVLNFPYILSALGKPGQQTKSPLGSSAVSIQPTAIPITLTVSAPQDNSISPEKSITVQGATQPKNTVVLENDLDQDIAQASSDGSFSFPLALSIGANDITVTSYNAALESASKTITVLYQEEQL